MILHYAPADSFVRWMAAHPGYLIVACLWRGSSSLAVLMKQCA